MAEAGILKTATEPARLRMKAEPEGRSDEAKPEEWSLDAADGQRLTKAESEGRGSPVEPVG